MIDIHAQPRVAYSVVIPTYDRERLLGQTISSVLRAASGRDDVQIVVADDGSSDSTPELVAGVQSDTEILYIRQPDRGFRAARARNLGMSVARGRIVVLLDCGVAVQANFFSVLDECATAETEVLVFPVVGFSNTDEGGVALDAAIAGVQTSDIASALIDDERFRDIREPVFRACDDDLSALPAPWAIAWTCCLAIHRAGALENTWFDERFVGWGGEDLEFALQLERRGATFRLERRTGAIHLPHAKSEPDNSKSSRANKTYLHQKHGRPDTKLLQTTSAVLLNGVLLQSGARDH